METGPGKYRHPNMTYLYAAGPAAAASYCAPLQ
jgi:hypothetical protein